MDTQSISTYVFAFNLSIQIHTFMKIHTTTYLILYNLWAFYQATMYKFFHKRY